MFVGFELLSCVLVVSAGTGCGGIVVMLVVSCGSSVSTSGVTITRLLGDSRLAQPSAILTVGVECDGRGLSATVLSLERSYRLAGSSVVGVNSDCGVRVRGVLSCVEWVLIDSAIF